MSQLLSHINMMITPYIHSFFFMSLCVVIGSSYKAVKNKRKGRNEKLRNSTAFCLSFFQLQPASIWQVMERGEENTEKQQSVCYSGVYGDTTRANTCTQQDSV